MRMPEGEGKIHCADPSFFANLCSKIMIDPSQASIYALHQNSRVDTATICFF